LGCYQFDVAGLKAINDTAVPRSMKMSFAPNRNERLVLIFCDGGLANRVNSLISGLAVTELLKLDHVVLWPRNNRCGAAFNDIFSSASRVFETRLQDLLPVEDELRPWLHENDYGFTGPVVQSRAISGTADLLRIADEDQRPILFCENIILPWLPEEATNRALNSLSFRPLITDRALTLLRKQEQLPYFGIHLRATDFTSPPPVEPMLAVVAANPLQRFFVCSDDADLELRFATFPNVFVNDKTAYVEKLGDGDWRGDVVDSDGLPYTSNIDRTAQSVIEAGVDLLLLAASTPIRTSSSSFLSLSERLKSSGFVDRHLYRGVRQDATTVSIVPHITTKGVPMANPFTSQDDVLEFLNLIRPRHLVSDFKVRIGADGDGGYVMTSRSRDSNLVISIGIGDQVSFDLALAEGGARVLQFDHTIAGAPVDHPNISFHRQGWGPHDEGQLVCLRTMMAMADWSDARHPILKFDTEGAEWASLDVAESTDLERFEVIAGEFHGFQSLMHRDYFSLTRRVLEKLSITHHPIHLHANNATGIVLVHGVPIPPLLEITFLRKTSGIFGAHSTEPIPGPLDRPNLADRPDICLRAY
jgi:hypothetical protein